MVTLSKQIGLVLTPAVIAEELVSWAVQNKNQTILDIGAGEGVFLCEAAKRLKALGCSDQQVQAQVFGVERDHPVYERACQTIKESIGTTLPQFLNADFFDTRFPPISAVVGNPPYVRRSTLDEIDRVRERVIFHDLFLARLPRLTDLYSYFLIYASQFLEPHGRIAVIISSSWMDTDYGIALKEFFLRNFRIRMLAICEGKLFADVLVKSVMLFAEKGTPSEADEVSFVRLPEFISGFSQMTRQQLGSLGSLATIRQTDLDERQPWGIYVRQPQAYFTLPVDKCTALGKVARTRIGIQPLARDFYILETAKADNLSIPKKYFQPLAFSPREISDPIIEDGESVSHRILFVSKPLPEIESKALVKYIKAAENTEVRIRGKERTVTGYQNLPRLQKAGRVPWYNLADEIKRRRRYSIFIPRRFYENFLVIWNKAGVVGNENFIEAQPIDKADTTALLSILNTSFFELGCRSRAQQYGGGVFNLNPLDVQELPVLNPRLLDARARQQTERAYLEFTRHLNRNRLDKEIAECFAISQEKLEIIQEGVTELRRLSMASKRPSLSQVSSSG
ncbi:N-6 DNA methylase [Acidobacteriia bacterium AH_259_A11_L15]|nr:N-6 DNA methylase [Acidobacteriia bacterium AH_259_A11_L15]